MIKFRADIEGLRGLAVLLVMLCHASVPGFAGGFIGVDLFFVISGYLIFGILAREVRANGRVDYANFYAHRIKRLFGALFVMIAVVCAFFALALPKSIQATQATSAFFTTLWTSNLHFAFADAGYFLETQSQQNAFLHTWSLGVEEQFYLLCPLLFAFAARAQSNRKQFALLLFLGSASLLGCMILSIQNASQAYYLMPTRIWQFMFGALAWRLPENGWRLQDFGLTLLALAVVLISDTSAFPWPWAVLPTLGAVLLVGKANANTPANKLLSLRPLRFFGRISYSLYLWHWPLLVIFSMYRPITDWREKCLVLLGATLIAALSEKFVERPLRYGRWTSKAVITQGLVATVLLSCALGTWVYSTSKAAQIAGEKNDLANRIRARTSIPDLYGTPGFDEYYHADRLAPKVANEPAGKPDKRVLIAGDSIAMQWLPAFEEIARRRNWELIAATKSSCPMIDAPIVNAYLKRRFVECETWRAALVRYVGEYAPDLLIMGNSTSLGLNDTAWIAGGRRMVGDVSSPNRDVVVIAANPKLAFDPVACLVVNGDVRGDRVFGNACASPLDNAAQQKEAMRLTSIVEGYPRVHVLALDDLVCPNARCDSMRDGSLVYRDAMHLNARFVESLNVSMEDRLFTLIH